MPGYPDVVIKDSLRIGAEFEIALRDIEKAEDCFGFKALVVDPELQALEDEFAKLCYPFLEGFQKTNAKFKKWFEKKLGA